MVQKLKSLILSLSLLLALSVPMMAPATASAAAIKNNLCSGANLDVTGGTTNCTPDQNGQGINELIAKIINWLSAIIGVVAVIMIIYAGFRYITSGGNDSGVASAKKTILYALIGLVIVALAQLIVKFVLNNV